MFGKKKFGLKQAKRSLAFAKSRGKLLTPDVAFGIEVAVAGLGFENTAASEARKAAAVAGATAAEAKRATKAAEERGMSRVKAFRKRCDNMVATINAAAKKVVDTVATHYQNAVARAEIRAEVKAEGYRAAARQAEKACAKATEIADLF